MRTFKVTEPKMMESLRVAALMIRQGNESLSNAKKQVDAGKAALALWLTENRDIALESLPIGELVQIEGIALITIGKQNKFDTKRFALEHPSQFETYKRDFLTVGFKSLV